MLAADLRGLIVELDITPKWWGAKEAQLVGQAVTRLLGTPIPFRGVAITDTGFRVFIAAVPESTGASLERVRQFLLQTVERCHTNEA